MPAKKARVIKRGRNKGKVILPKPDPETDLGKYGYKLSRSKQERRKALRAAAKDNGTRSVLRRVNLIRTYSKNTQPENHARYTEDVEFMSRLLARENAASKKKKTKSKSKSKGRKKTTKKRSVPKKKTKSKSRGRRKAAPKKRTGSKKRSAPKKRTGSKRRR